MTVATVQFTLDTAEPDDDTLAATTQGIQASHPSLSLLPFETIDLTWAPLASSPVVASALAHTSRSTRPFST